jgi:hypothetical protein
MLNVFSLSLGGFIAAWLLGWPEYTVGFAGGILFGGAYAVFAQRVAK